MDQVRSGLAAILCLLMMMGAQARGMGNPDRLMAEMAHTLEEQGQVLEQVTAILNSIHHEQLFPRKSFWGVPVQWYASRLEPPRRGRHGEYKWKDRKQTLYLTTYVSPGELSLLSDRYAARRQIGSIPLLNEGAEIRQVIFDMRSPQVFLFNSWWAFRSRGDVGGEALRRLLKDRTEAELPAKLAHAGPFLQRAVPTSLYNPDGSLLESLGVPKKDRDRVQKQILDEWDKLIPLHRKQRKLWQQTISAIQPQVLRAPYTLPKQEAYALGDGAFEAGRYAEAVVKKSTPFVMNYADSIVDEAPKGNNFVELHVADAIGGFQVYGEGSEKARRAATFESILESFVEKGKAVRKPAEKTPYARMLRIGKGWVTYEGVPQKGVYQGVILYHADSGRGYWITSATQAIEQLRPLAEKYNQLQQKLRRQVVTYNALVIRKIVRQNKASVSKGSDSAQDAF